ncbi:hypothetical protein Leryth_013114 [Lithospermum erythrorhizon]|nr:hypothetical protein Leryth_013114 [Lithospermum erythrorhizon]
MEKTVGDIGATKTVKIKTVELKVSVHCKCEGCENKVTKVIQSVKGIHPQYITYINPYVHYFVFF